MTSLESFFAGGSGRSISWKDKPIGTEVEGVITAVHPPSQQTNPKTGELEFFASGDPKMFVRIDLDTDLRGWAMMSKPPDDPTEVDDGSRSLYVQGKLQAAVGNALRKAGRKGPPEVGGRVKVTLTAREPNANPVLSPTNIFDATYVSPASAATGEFFGNGAAGSDPWRKGDGTPASGPVKPESIDQKAWDAMDAATRTAIAATLTQLTPQSDEPPF